MIGDIVLSHSAALTYSPLIVLCDLVCSDSYCAVCRHLTCPAENRFCPLCTRNPLKRCRSTENFATKHCEKLPLAAACGAPIVVAFSTGQAARQPSSAGPSSSLAGSAEQQHGLVRLEVCTFICCCMMQASCCNQQQLMPSVLVTKQQILR